MSSSTPPVSTVNGEPTLAPVQGVVVLNESDYRQLIEQQQELKALRNRVEELEEKFTVLREACLDLHRAYHAQIKHQLPPFDEDPNWKPPAPEEAVPLTDLLAEINRTTSR